jgi:hypothetical protein
MKLVEIAGRIHTHLTRIEEDPMLNPLVERRGSKLHMFYSSGAWTSGRFVYVSYVGYQGATHLTRDEAATYLAWLDAGNVGRHYGALGG